MKIVNGVGPYKPDICIIGEAPGAEEDKEGKPFVGRSGKLLDKVLADVGLNRNDCYITNVIKIRPPSNKTPSNKQIKLANEFLLEEWNLVNPKVTILLGSTALKGVTGRFDVPLLEVRGKPLGVVNKYNGFQTFPTYHPAYILRNPKLYDTWIKDFKLALDYLNR